MKSAREIVEPIYDGADYQPWRMLGMTCGALEELVASVQKDAFDAGVVEGMRRAVKSKKPPEYPDQLDILNSL